MSLRTLTPPNDFKGYHDCAPFFLQKLLLRCLKRAKIRMRAPKLSFIDVFSPSFAYFTKLYLHTQNAIYPKNNKPNNNNF